MKLASDIKAMQKSVMTWRAITFLVYLFVKSLFSLNKCSCFILECSQKSLLWHKKIFYILGFSTFWYLVHWIYGTSPYLFVIVLILCVLFACRLYVYIYAMILLGKNNAIVKNILLQNYRLKNIYNLQNLQWYYGKGQWQHKQHYVGGKASRS